MRKVFALALLICLNCTGLAAHSESGMPESNANMQTDKTPGPEGGERADAAKGSKPAAAFFDTKVAVAEIEELRTKSRAALKGGKFSEALGPLSAAMNIAMEKLGPADMLTAVLLEEVGHVFEQLGKPQEALQSYRSAFTVWSYLTDQLRKANFVDDSNNVSLHAQLARAGGLEQFCSLASQLMIADAIRFKRLKDAG